ncbi:5-dehydro-4-deoxy-D-glucuronate isomerase [Rhodocytophaga rosea]|uniref:4-deoxy-L-threo-5-hexosulose-uronate ketol-isomerase n=1 Tax=Rhodocytophaga rosea TaxID=2704465 RepID=A0A6C0GVL4_9BACT|nr:5-dehydro-4-deoxy-D-glucuronate isomerase [Rhodocytophaga rosea]QHT71854.1 5-dehydro-4-deoxy-D-glucuronate isomerase [Rhodocytophaga rosea]
MQTRYASSPNEVTSFNTEQLRENFLIENIFTPDTLQFVYSHYDRVIIGGILPIGDISLPTYPELKADYFLERREIGIINVGGAGSIEVEGKQYILHKLDCLYIGKGNKQVVFKSEKAAEPARFFLLSAPAHQKYPTTLMTSSEASPVEMGETKTSNQRTIYKYIHGEGIKSCQLVMGLTVLKSGSVWNTMPAHIHDRRMEAYFYFDVPEEQRVFHLMGQPAQTRHLLVANHQAVISPPWSIHSGAGTSNYSFIWGMAGENYTFTDMDFVAIKDLR